MSKVASAADTLRDFDHGVELDILTFGQFSLIDAIEAVLAITGPADVDLATWTAAEFDLSQIQQQITTAGIRRLRLIIDRSFVSRQPKFVELIHDRFGQDSVRSTRLHAKFATLSNEAWKVVMRTSMNLNDNPRLEYLQVTADPALHTFYTQIVHEIFAETPLGIENRRGVPDLPGIEGMEPIRHVRMGQPPRTR